MRFVSGLSTQRDPHRAIAEAIVDAEAELEGPADVAFAFASPTYGNDLARIPQLLAEHTGATEVSGCTGGGVLASGREIESLTGIAVLAGRLSNAQALTRHVTSFDLPGPDAPPSAWAKALDLPREEIVGFAVFTDPFQFPANVLLEGLDYCWPGTTKIGGIASGSRHPQGTHLFHRRSTHSSGAIVTAFVGDMRLHGLVAQGCRPVGKAMTITQSDRHRLQRVNGASAIDYLRTTLEGLGEGDRQSAQVGNLFLGIAQNPLAQQAPGPGDFLIRNVVGVDEAAGELQIAGLLRAGTTVQFHLRDAEASGHDLKAVLKKSSIPDPAGVLLCTCLGRGEHLYRAPDVDSMAIRDSLGAPPVAGFFCNGEFGPVGSETFIHGYTAAMGLFAEGTE